MSLSVCHLKKLQVNFDGDSFKLEFPCAGANWLVSGKSVMNLLSATSGQKLTFCSVYIGML